MNCKDLVAREYGHWAILARKVYVPSFLVPAGVLGLAGDVLTRDESAELIRCLAAYSNSWQRQETHMRAVAAALPAAEACMRYNADVYAAKIVLRAYSAHTKAAKAKGEQPLPMDEWYAHWLA